MDEGCRISLTLMVDTGPGSRASSSLNRYTVLTSPAASSWTSPTTKKAKAANSAPATSPVVRENHRDKAAPCVVDMFT